MPLWGNVDNAANSDIAVLAQVNKNISTAERTELYNNTVADAYFTNVTVGQFGVDTQEMAAVPAGSAKPPHAGWNLRTVGSGGRAGRVFYETLVAMGSMTDDGEDIVLPDYTIIINTQPSAATGNSTNNDVATFTVGAVTQPTGGTIAYNWHYSTDGGSTWTTANGVSGYINDRTATLRVLANTVATATNVRAMLSVTGATTQNTSAAKLTVVT